MTAYHRQTIPEHDRAAMNLATPPNMSSMETNQGYQGIQALINIEMQKNDCYQGPDDNADHVYDDVVSI